MHRTRVTSGLYHSPLSIRHRGKIVTAVCEIRGSDIPGLETSPQISRAGSCTLSSSASNSAYTSGLIHAWLISRSCVYRSILYIRLVPCMADIRGAGHTDCTNRLHPDNHAALTEWIRYGQSIQANDMPNTLFFISAQADAHFYRNLIH